MKSPPLFGRAFVLPALLAEAAELGTLLRVPERKDESNFFWRELVHERSLLAGMYFQSTTAGTGNQSVFAFPIIEHTFVSCQDTQTLCQSVIWDWKGESIQ